MVEIFQHLDFMINYTKSLLSQLQELEFLGVQVSSCPPTFNLPLHKLKGLETKATQLLKKSTSQASISVREIAQFIGSQGNNISTMQLCQAGMGVVHVTKNHNHLPGYLNTTADRESQTLQDRWDW